MPCDGSPSRKRASVIEAAYSTCGGRRSVRHQHALDRRHGAGNENRTPALSACARRRRCWRRWSPGTERLKSRGEIAPLIGDPIEDGANRRRRAEKGAAQVMDDCWGSLSISGAVGSPVAVLAVRPIFRQQVRHFDGNFSCPSGSMKSSAPRTNLQRQYLRSGLGR